MQIKGYLLFFSNLTEDDISNKTFIEALDLINWHVKYRFNEQFEWFKAFTIYNTQSSAIAYSATQSKKGCNNLNKFINEVSKRKLV